jgi:hypothetical protein
MTSSKEGLLTDVATALGATLGRVVHTTNELVDTAKRKASGGPARPVRKAARTAKSRVRATVKAAKRASHRASRPGKRTRKVANAKARNSTKKAHRTVP